MKNLAKLKKLSLVELKTIKAGANGITDGTNFHPSVPAPTTQSCTGGCTSDINLSTGVQTPTSGTWTYDW